MKDIIKNILVDAINRTYPNKNFIKLIEVQNVTAKNVDADFFSNISMKLSKELKTNPMEIANQLIKNMSMNSDMQIDVVKPGYINFLIKDTKKNNIISAINSNNDLLENCRANNKLNINVEFVSANPTGPLHVGHGRGVIYGNIIAKFLKIQGHDVTKEYYVNDHGNQIKKLCLSVLSQINTIYGENEEELYQGNYIKEIALLMQKNNLELPELSVNKDNNIIIPERTRNFIVESIIKRIKKQLDDLNVSFDSWFYETSLFDAKNKYNPDTLI